MSNELLWHNKFITTKICKRECMLYLSNWINSGILYVKDLQFMDEKVDTTSIFDVVKTVLNLYKNNLQQIQLNIRSLDKQDSG